MEASFLLLHLHKLVSSVSVTHAQVYIGAYTHSHTHTLTQRYYRASVKLHRVYDLVIKADIICSLELSFQDVPQLLTSTNGLGLRSTANLKWQSSQ